MTNYFSFFDLPVAPLLDEAVLRQKFLANSKKYHPDFFTLETDAKQAEILELSTLNNQAYKILKEEDQRLKHLLEIKGALAPEGQNTVPQDFLMEMMDINEGLMDLQLEPDPARRQEVEQAVKAFEDNLLDDVRAIMENYQDEHVTAGELTALKDYYLKKRYLLRIHKNLSTFAPH
ncbi:MAG: Fe-S protein assembly co-chaperone HscB [Bacteroidetes bacterium]|nr:MAG: Fe-S protein assembly co-chaperone HscB [Bacteroidota bacterium]PTM11241.1 MAG: Fe-S protein assembly co-chaperone HscB [Bacteroidota bacterium]